MGAFDPRPEPVRQVSARDAGGYVEDLGVRPGDAVRFHLSTPAAYALEVVRLGRSAIIDAGADGAADLVEAEEVGRFEETEASPQVVQPGSYLYAGGPPLPAGPFTCGLWLRPWRVPVIDAMQWAWSGLITDLDFPDHTRFALLIDHNGRIGLALGDGGTFVHAAVTYAEPALRDRLGRWFHVAATAGHDIVTIYVDGKEVARAPSPLPGGLTEPGPRSRLRIGAFAERGAADDLLDADIAAPFVAAGTLEPSALRRVVADRGRSLLGELQLGPLQAAWDLAEEAGHDVADSSGHGRHATLVGGGTWQIGGPAFDASLGAPGYEPSTDPDRGHGLRLSSDDLLDCRWPVSHEWTVPADAPSGLYCGLLRLSGRPRSEATPITFAVVRREPRRPGSVALLLSTNTWYAYGRRPTVTAPSFGLSASFYSTHLSGQPHFWLTTQAPIPRATPFGFESERAAFIGHSHLVRPERYAEAWLEREGFAYEVITDGDLQVEPGLLDRFAALLIAGHSEYWSHEARDEVERYLDAGGNVLSLSGDSCHWRVSFDDNGLVLECRKDVSDYDYRWLAPERWGERWHTHDGCPGGCFRLIGRYAHEMLGLDPQGMIDDGTSSGFRALRVLEPEHHLFREPRQVRFSPDGMIGERSLNGPRVSGYEFDAVREAVGTHPEPLSGLTLLGTTRQPNLEWAGADPDQGADLILWERPRGGRVVSLGSIGATGALAVDAGIGAFAANVLDWFGVAGPDRGQGREVGPRPPHQP